MLKDIPSQAHHVLYFPPFTSDKLGSADVIEETFQLQLAYGRAEIKHWYFDGIRILYCKNYYNDYYTFEKNNDLDVVRLEFNLKGNYTLSQFGHSFQVKSRLHNMVYYNGFNNNFRNDDLQLETFDIQFAPPVFLRIIEDGNDMLKQFAERMIEKRPVLISNTPLLINPNLQRAIGDILHCQYSKSLKKLFLLSKSIEILVMQAEAYHNATLTKATYCKRVDDKERIMYAGEYIVKNIESPPSLSELSKIVGVNEFKLKKGFKEIFNTTVFGYLSDYRLDMAKQELQEGSKSVSEIASDLGFSSLQHFSNAFKKKFGISPRLSKK